ncbi:ATP-dependent DNA helicase RecQ [compost metagenome]
MTADGYFSTPLPGQSVKRAGEDPIHILGRVFGYDEFRSIQKDVITNACGGRDTFALMTTGGGKSLCYQIPALHFEGMAIVVSPLVSLMKDQVDALRRKGVRASALNSNLSDLELAETTSAVREGTIDILYVAPERLVTPSFLRLVSSSAARISSVTVDESHVIVSWGRDFRESYLRVGEFIDMHPDAVAMAMTATAGPDDVSEILDRLHMRDADVFATSFDRPNIRIQFDGQSGEADIPELLERRGEGSAIVFCATKRKVDELAAYLQTLGLPAIPYHAGLDSEVKSANQQRFLDEQGSIVVATVAFGMGIDKADVRLVIHTHVPSALEDWYQEIGRAGRDGLPSLAITLTRASSLSSTMRPMLEEIEKAGDDRERQATAFRRIARLQTMWGFVESPDCRRSVFLCMMGESHPGGCGNCDRCLEPVARVDASSDARLLVKAVTASGQRYGLGYLVEVLQGIPTERVCVNGHNELNVFGKGRHLARKDWAALHRQLLISGALTAQPTGALTLGKAGWPILQGRRSFHLAGEPLADAPVVRKRSSGLSRGVNLMIDGLIALREREAASSGEEPHSILTDREIEIIVAGRPDSEADLMDMVADMAERRALLPQLVLAALGKEKPSSADADDSIASVSLF